MRFYYSKFTLFYHFNIENAFVLFESKDVQVMCKAKYLTNDHLGRGDTCSLFR